MVKKLEHKERMDSRKVRLIGFLSFLMGIISSSLIYVTSDYIKESSGVEGVGSFYVAAYLIIFILLLYFHKIVNKFGKIRVFLFVQLFKVGLLSVLSIIPTEYPGAVLLTTYMIFSYMTWVEMDSILEVFSIDRMSGRIRGLYLLLSNIGYVIGPLAATQILDNFGFASVFLFTMLISLVLFITTLVKLRNVRGEIREILEPRELIRKAFLNKDVFNIYLVSVSLELFFALAIVYMPLHLLNMGFDWSQVGLMLVFSMIPYILFQYPAGILADKKFGEKELLFFAIFLTSISTMLIYFIESTSIIFWSFMMILTRIGPSLMELLRDSYFYKKVDGRDLDMIDFFRTAGPVGIIFGTLISSMSLILLPMKSIFLLSGIMIMLGVLPAMRLVDNFSEEEIEIGKGEIKFRNRFGLLRVLGRRLQFRKIRGVVR